MRYFTLEEARKAIPTLEKIFGTVTEITARADAKAKRVTVLEKIPQVDAVELAIENAQLDFLAVSLEDALKGIEQMGAFVKGLNPGLVDFPCRLDSGEEVCLCWQYGEKDIRFYHGTEEGFSSRKPLVPAAVNH